MLITKARWQALCQYLKLRVDDQIYSELRDAYTEPQRAYHTLEHLSECLQHLDWVATQHIYSTADLAQVEMVLWFHDAIYQPQASDNEQQSAQWARRFLMHSAVGPELSNRVYGLIMATCHGAKTPSDPLAQLTVDIDLTILGAAPERFKTYEQQVRYEYAWVPEALYHKKRNALLAAFLAQPQLYQTPLFYQRYEQQARHNLMRAIG